MELFKDHEHRDPAEILTEPLSTPIAYKSHRTFVKQVLEKEVDLRPHGGRFVAGGRDTAASATYRQHINSQGSPSETVASGYRWSPGTELARDRVLHDA